MNIGLDLKFEGRQLKVDGYSKRTEHGWSYSDSAVRLIEGYIRSFPRLFQQLQRLEDKEDFYTEEELFPPAPEGQEAETLADLVQWLKDSGARSLRQIPLDVETLSEDQVKLVEAAQDAV